MPQQPLFRAILLRLCGDTVAGAAPKEQAWGSPRPPRGSPFADQQPVCRHAAAGRYHQRTLQEAWPGPRRCGPRGARHRQAGVWARACTQKAFCPVLCSWGYSIGAAGKAPPWVTSRQHGPRWLRRAVGIPPLFHLRLPRAAESLRLPDPCDDSQRRPQCIRTPGARQEVCPPGSRTQTLMV